MSDRRTFVIAGGGLAGAKAAETLRAEGFDGRVVLVGAEPEPPYERPPLSKGYLAGESTADQARVHGPGFYEQQRIELLAGRVATGLDVAARELALADGSRLRFDRLLIATGAVPRRPAIDGADLPGVHLLRTIADADALRGVIRRGGRLAVIGAGWIGCEVAATAATRGAHVTLIEQASAPLEPVLGARLGRFFADLHREHGVDLRTHARVERITPGMKVELADAPAVEADAIVLGVGVSPATALAEAAGLEVDDGVVADARLATAAAGIFVAGDVASALHPRYGRRIRVEHWATARGHGAVAARNMLGGATAYADVPSFFSDQYDAGLEYFGLHDRGDRLVVRGMIDDGRFQAFWLDRDATVTAAMHVNDWDAGAAIRRLVEAGSRVDPHGLAERDLPLDAVAAEPAVRAL